NADPLKSRVLPAPRGFAAVAVATRYNSHFAGSALYVIGGIDSAGRAQPSVLAADVTPDSVVGRFAPIEPLPAPVVGATAVVRRGRIYVIGGTDSLGRPQRSVFVGRIAAARLGRYGAGEPRFGFLGRPLGVGDHAVPRPPIAVRDAGLGRRRPARRRYVRRRRHERCGNARGRGDRRLARPVHGARRL